MSFSLLHAKDDKPKFKFLVEVDSSTLAYSTFKELDQAYRSHSPDGKSRFFQTWKRISDSIYRLPLPQDEVGRRVYSLFEATFFPDTLGVKDLFKNVSKEIGSTEEGKKGIEGMREAKAKVDGFPKDAKYVVLQSAIKYTLCISSELTNPDDPGVCAKVGEITGFHPKVRFFNKPILIATRPYDAVIPGFLMDKSMKLNDSGTKIDLEELFRKKEFLRPQLEVVHSSKSAGWYGHTFPVVHSMNFNPSLDVVSMMYSKSPDELYCTRYRYYAQKWHIIGSCNAGRSSAD